MNGNLVIIMLLVILIVLYAIDMNNREKFSIYSRNNIEYDNINYNIRNPEFSLPKRVNICNNMKITPETKKEYKEDIKYNKECILDNTSLESNLIDIKSLNSMDSDYNTLNDIDEELISVNYN